MARFAKVCLFFAALFLLVGAYRLGSMSGKHTAIIGKVADMVVPAAEAYDGCSSNSQSKHGRDNTVGTSTTVSCRTRTCHSSSAYTTYTTSGGSLPGGTPGQFPIVHMVTMSMSNVPSNAPACTEGTWKTL